MTTAALEPHGQGWLRRAWDFVAVQVPAEVRKVTWPSWDELKKATGVIVVFVIFLGVPIGLMDSVLQLVLVSAVGNLFKRRTIAGTRSRLPRGTPHPRGRLPGRASGAA